MHDLIILGAGPAGLAAAVYAIKKRLDFMVVSPDIGGKTTWQLQIEDADSNETVRAAELVTLYRTRVESLRHSMKKARAEAIGRTEGGLVVTAGGESLEAKAVIAATGTSVRSLDVSGESEFRAKGIGYSSISYSHLLAGRRVFLAGDSDRVINAAIEMSLHADQVSLGLLAEGSFSPALVGRAKAIERISVHERAAIEAFTGDAYARAVTLHSDGETTVVEADGFFVELEPRPNTEFASEIGVVDARGYITVDGQNATSVPGLYGAGDVTGNGFEQILVSLGDGAKAVLSAYEYLLSVGITGR